MWNLIKKLKHKNLNNSIEPLDKSELSRLLNTYNSDVSYFEDIVREQEYRTFNDILVSHDVILNKITEREKELDRKLQQINEDIKLNSDCDKWDYLFATSAGGLLD